MSRVPATIHDFNVGDEIAYGSLATIQKATHKKSGKVYALKVLNMRHLQRRKMIQSAMMERAALVKLCSQEKLHPGIIRLHYSFKDEINLYFALDLAPNGDLKEVTLKAEKLSLECARYYTAQMVDAILFMHEAGVAHRDIKPENCLLDADMRIKLADFGSAYVNDNLDSPRTSTFVGTAMFISPEIIQRSKCDPKGPDLWATGASLYFYLFGKYPFSAATDYLIMERVKKMDYTIPEDADPDAADLIKRLLVANTERLGLAPHSSPQELRDHAFFAEIDWDTLWTGPAPMIVYPKKKEKDPRDEIWAKFEELNLAPESE